MWQRTMDENAAIYVAEQKQLEEDNAMLARAAAYDSEPSEEGDKDEFPEYKHQEVYFDDPHDWQANLAKILTPSVGEDMPLRDNYQSLNMSGKVTALSVNKNPGAMVQGQPTKDSYTVTIALSTEDADAVKHLMLIRSRAPIRGLAAITADLIVWPT
jgi:hypothetical protein